MEIKATINIEGLTGILNDRNITGTIDSGTAQARTYRIRTMDLSGGGASISVYNISTNEDRTVKFTEMTSPEGYDFGDFRIDYGQTESSMYSIHAVRDCSLSYRNRDDLTFKRSDMPGGSIQPVFAYNDGVGEACIVI